jgi:hypothetical protein
MVFTTTREFNVDGAPSTPLGIDPLAGKPILSKDLGNAALEQLVAQYVAAGMPEEQARRVAANQVKMYGPQGAIRLANERASRPGDVRDAAAALAKDDERNAQMKAGYDRATGLGPASPELEAQFADSERYYAEQGRLRRAGLHSQTPVDPGTPEQQASWNQFLEDNPDEMRRYRPQEAAARDAAARDAETKQLYPTIVAKYGEGEAKAWLAARQAGDVYVPTTAHQQSMNAQRQADELAAARGNGEARGRLDEADARYTRQVSTPRWIREANLNPDDPAVQAMSPGALRLKAHNARNSDKQARELQWRAQVMMNAGNRLGALALPGLNDWQRAAIVGGPTPAAVEATKNQQLTELGLRVAQGRGFQQATPEQQAMAAQQADTQLRQTNPVAAGVKDIQGGRWDSPEGLAEVDRQRDLMDNDWGGFSYESERALAAKLQQPPYNMSQAEAEAAAHQSANRERFPWNRSTKPASQLPANPDPEWGMPVT